MLEKTITIEITSINDLRDSWWNQCVGEKFEAIEINPLCYQLTENGLTKLSSFIGKNATYATISTKFASPEGQLIHSNNIETFPLVQKHIKFLIEVRRFTVKENVSLFNRQGEVTKRILTKGEVYEERYDKPNQIVKVDEKGEIINSYNLIDINKNSLLLPALECNETIPAKESLYFTLRKKTIESEYARKMKNIESLKNEINNLEFLLDIPQQSKD